ncbi:unnamed protein product [Caenorhabditis sp. 36 PRJEB53466]|nr:unnamed protein product [Caenorhabditis sp. 36 PRJEB53466]
MGVAPADSDQAVIKQESDISLDCNRSPLHDRTTKWRAMWIAVGMQFVVGVQISVYYMSMWPYLSGLDKTADMDFLGWVVAAWTVACKSCSASPFSSPSTSSTIRGGSTRDRSTTCRQWEAVSIRTRGAFVFFFGIAFLTVEAPATALYSEILGPRKQGNMQGWFSFGGSFTPFVASITITYLFQHTGYKYLILLQSGTILLAFLLIAIFYKRLVPLKLHKKMVSRRRKILSDIVEK